MNRIIGVVILALIVQVTAVGRACAEEPPSFLRAWGSDVLVSPGGIFVDAQSNVYVGDVGAKKLFKFRKDGLLLDEVGSGDQPFAGPGDVVVRTDGHVFLTDALSQMFEFDSNLNFVNRWTVQGSYIALDATEQFIYAGLGDSVFKYTTAGAIVQRWAFGGNPRVTNVTGIAVGPGGDVYVGNLGERTIHKYSADGAFLLAWTGPAGDPFGPRGLAVDANENVYVSQFDRVWKFTSTGQLLSQWGTLGSGDGEFGVAQDVAIDEDGLIYVTDDGNARVQIFGYIPIAVERTTLGRLKARYR